MLCYEGLTQADVCVALDVAQSDLSRMLRRIVDDLHRVSDVQSTQRTGGVTSD